MAKFRKKPVEVEAWQWTGQGRSAWPPYMGGNFVTQIKDGRKVVELRIQTLEGAMTAQRGDWIICGVKGEVYPCKPGIFAMTYEPKQ